jgi:hypothetical protein
MSTEVSKMSHAAVFDSYSGPRTTWAVLRCSAAAVLVAFTMSACAGSDAAADSSAGAGASAADVVPSADLCRFLKTELPKIKAAGSEVGARAQLATDMFSLFQTYNGAIPDGDQVDAQTKRDCADARTQIIEVAGKDGFTAI